MVDSAEVLKVDERDDDRPGRDSLGTPGRIQSQSQLGLLRVTRPRDTIVEELVETGLTTLRDNAAETELERAPAEEPSLLLADPFLLEDRLTVRVEGRQFPGAQRQILERKVAQLRSELEDPKTKPSRRKAVGPMLEELEQGLRSKVEVRSIKRRFQPHVQIKDAVDSVGDILPIRAGTRLVYRVNSIDQAAGEEGEAEPMVFHVIAMGQREAVVLYTGGVHGMRHLRDLEESPVHNAWFANRERAKTDATAPWLGRRVYRDLVECGSGEVVIHRRRDPEAIAIEKIGEDRSIVRVDGRPLDVPVIRCRTSQDDDLVVLADPQNPLVLRLEEAGADLLRTIDDVLSAPGHPYLFPGDESRALDALTG
jgi:hypothetical protein